MMLCHDLMSDHALLVVSRFNEAVTRRLLDGALGALGRAGYDDTRREIVWVPGAFEIPVAVRRGLESRRFGVVVAIGAIIRGETPHFDHLAAEVTRGLGSIALDTGLPVGYGVLTCDSLEQALARSGGEAGNKGAEAVEAALEARRVMDDLDERSAH